MLYSVLRKTVSPLVKWVYRMRIIGTEHIPEQGKVILCSNHRSVMDPVFLGASVKKRQIHYMAKEELFLQHGKAVNKFLHALGAFPVKRNSGDAQALKMAIALLEQGGLLGIFPQGGIVQYGISFQPKSGVAMIAYHAKAPVMPVSIYINEGMKLFRPVTIRFGKPIRYDAFGFTNGSRKEIRHAAGMIAERVNRLLEEKHEHRSGRISRILFWRR